MEKFEITILGCGAALPTPHHFCSSQLINIREKLFMVDCAEGIQMQLRRNHYKFTRINGIFISHLHGDHCFGLMGLISSLSLLGRTATLHIWGPKPIEDTFSPQIKFFCPDLRYKVEFHEVDTRKAQVIYDDRSVSVETIPLKHCVPCCGYLFKEKSLKRHIKRDVLDAYKIPICYINNIKLGMDYTLPDGTVIPNETLTEPADPKRSYAYCSDTMYAPQNAKQMYEVDLLYHEATFKEEHKLLSKKTFHSTTIDAAEMARLCNAKQLMIGHFSSRYRNEEELLKECKSVFLRTILAKENLCIKL